MSIPARKGSDEAFYSLVKAFNADRIARVSTNFHVSKTVERSSGDFMNPTITDAVANAANGSDLPTCLTLAAELRALVLLHSADGVAHKVKDTVFAGIAAAPTDLATLQTFLNDMKSKMNTHIASTTYHYNADGTNTITAANASDLGTSITLINELKTDFNAHMAGALGGYSIKMVDP